MRAVNTFYTKIVGVTFNNTGTNTQNRQRIIAELLREGKLEKGTELVLKRLPDNPYDSNAVAVLAPDGRQLGFLSRDVAQNVSPLIASGVSYRAFVEAVTGGDADSVYGINIKIVSEGVSSQSTPTPLGDQKEEIDTRDIDRNITKIPVRSEFWDLQPTSRMLQWSRIVADEPSWRYVSCKASTKATKNVPKDTLELAKDLINAKASYQGVGRGTISVVDVLDGRITLKTMDGSEYRFRAKDFEKYGSFESEKAKRIFSMVFCRGPDPSKSVGQEESGKKYTGYGGNIYDYYGCEEPDDVGSYEQEIDEKLDDNFYSGDFNSDWDWTDE